MLKDLEVRKLQMIGFAEILLDNGYIYNEIDENAAIISLKDFDGKLIVILENDILYVQHELALLKDLDQSAELYKKLLDVNTEILPVSVAIDSTDAGNEKIVINESLYVNNLDVDELIQVLEAIELNIPMILDIISEHKK